MLASKTRSIWRKNVIAYGLPVVFYDPTVPVVTVVPIVTVVSVFPIPTLDAVVSIRLVNRHYK